MPLLERGKLSKEGIGGVYSTLVAGLSPLLSEAKVGPPPAKIARKRKRVGKNKGGVSKKRKKLKVIRKGIGKKKATAAKKKHYKKKKKKKKGGALNPKLLSKSKRYVEKKALDEDLFDM